MDDYPDLRQLMASRTQQLVQFPDPFSVVRPYNNYHHPNSIVVDHQEANSTHGLFEFRSAASASAPPSFSTIISNISSVAAKQNGSTAGSPVGSLYGLELMNHHRHGWSINGNDGSAGKNSRWPRQETLTLLEIRSGLDSKFKETNQKGPLWDEVSRIMSEEHGYQRSGKKCKEKFENLYKYYKKTKGKAGRQDGKHYRFFRQLEAIYGEPSTANPFCSTSDQPNLLTGTLNPSLLYNPTISAAAINQEYQVKPGDESLSFSNNSTDLETSTSENNGDDDDDLSNSANDNQRCSRRVKKKTWKAQVEELVNSQMKKVMKAQESWMEKMLKTIEGREEERFSKEEEWRKKEAERFSQQVDEFWAKERAWVETRDASIMEALSQMGSNSSYKTKAKDVNMGGLQLMDGGLLPSSSNYMNMDSSSLNIPTNEVENLWNMYGGKLSK